jgi:hypothetical protein
MLLSQGKYERHISQGKPAFYSPRSSVKKHFFAVLHSCNCKDRKKCLIPAKNAFTYTGLYNLQCLLCHCSGFVITKMLKTFIKNTAWLREILKYCRTRSLHFRIFMKLA